MEFVDRPVRVLYIEGSSRWEYRYFKNLLLREKDVDSSVMLLSADRDFAQEGNMAVTRIPTTREEFEGNFRDLCQFHAMGEGFTWETQDRARDVAMAQAAWQREQSSLNFSTT